jgi:IS30 family transposase
VKAKVSEDKEEPRQKRPWRRITEELKQRVGRLMKQGLTMDQIAQAVDRDERIVRAIIKEKGGIFRTPEAESGLRLSLPERDEIFRGLVLGWSFRVVAQGLDRAPSTVSREVNSNGGRELYRPSEAHAQAQRLRLRPRPPKLLACARLHDEVVAGLELFWSPRQISLRLEQDYPDELEMRVSPETIYQSLFVQARGALRADLTKHLRTGRTRRRPAVGHLEGRGRLKDMIMISERPAEVEDRAVPGHWEGDLIIGRNNKSAIGTLVERWSRFVMLLYLPDGFGSEAVLKALTAKIQTLPTALRRSLTWDQGKEMALHASFTMATDMPIYFCDPHSPWQRGSNENTNGLLRQFFPKGTDLSEHPEEYLDYVSDLLNGRPRETLAWLKPCEKFAEAVAMTG